VLAGGIAHDFNNLLVAILGNADLALLDLSPVSPARPMIEDVKMAAIRASELTNQMLAYSGKGRFVVEALDLNELVEEMSHLLRVSISGKTVLNLHLADNLPAVQADASQMRQIVMNLITNAADAVGEKSGVVSISTGAMEASRDYLSETYVNENLPEGYYVYLEVSDTGCGMDEETRAKLFDPFFTTKFAGRGLGMAAVLGIVRAHSGAVKVYSERGKGSTLKVLLPCSEEAIEALGREGPTEQPGELGRCTGTVLVVEDEDTVRNVAKMMLERAGFDVLTAADGREGVELFREHADRVGAVLLDMTMPGLSGEETFRELRVIRRDVRVILCSGYNEQDVTSRFVGKRLAGFMQKPFELHALIAKVRDVLGTTGPG